MLPLQALFFGVIGLGSFLNWIVSFKIRATVVLIGLEQKLVMLTLLAFAILNVSDGQDPTIEVTKVVLPAFLW
jgi:hypothetical protein